MRTEPITSKGIFTTSSFVETSADKEGTEVTEDLDGEDAIPPIDSGGLTEAGAAGDRPKLQHLHEVLFFF